jgi:DNA-binding transcriptional LysR family regulator
MIDTLLRIRVFIAAYEERSYTVAAKREHLTQSGVTHHIQQLQHYLGAKLFVRQLGNIMTPTPAADAYYLGCVAILREHSKARLAVKPFAHGLSSELRIGLTPTLTTKMLAPTLLAFIEQHPNVSVQIVDSYSDLVVKNLLAGEIDLAVVPGIRSVIGLRSTPFVRMPELLVSGDKAHGRPVRLAEMGPIKIILPSQKQARRKGLDHYLSLAGADIERVLEIDSALGGSDLIRHSDWFGIHPASVAITEMQSEGFIVSPLMDPPLNLDLFVLERKSDTISPEATAFIDELRLQTNNAILITQSLLTENVKKKVGGRSLS